MVYDVFFYKKGVVQDDLLPRKKKTGIIPSEAKKISGQNETQN